MPNLGGELHHRWLERVLVWNIDGNFVCAALVWGPRWAFERPSEICNVVPDSLCKDLRGGISTDVCKVFGYPPSLMSGHCLS